MSIILKTIKTPESYYVYDRGHNAIIHLDEEEYKELNAVEHKKILEENSAVIQSFQRNGYLEENVVKAIAHPCSSSLCHHLTHHIEQMTLQVTQRCNLRCKYCVYGGNYDNRLHSDFDMDFETAIKALDLFLNACAEVEEPVLGFYGGEPLLKIDLIKQCIDYVNKKVPTKKFRYAITTNGTLLTVPIAKYLNENNFSITVSLDGSEKEHDENRVFANGRGSFETIMKNLTAVRKEVPDLQISFNSVFNPNHNYENVKKYFEQGEIIADLDVAMQLVQFNGSEEMESFSDEYYLIRAYDYFKLLLHMTGRLDVKEVTKLILSEKASIIKRYDLVSSKVKLGKTVHHSGPCIAGARRLFVNAHGDLFPCERVSETSEIMRIGDLDHGIDVNRAYNITNVGKVTENECKNCWALVFCSLCADKADGKEELSREVKLKHCKGSKESAYLDLMELCVLKELGGIFEEDFSWKENE